jgi:hypothetical protein
MPFLEINDDPPGTALRVNTNSDYGASSPDPMTTTFSLDTDTETFITSIERNREWREYAVQKIRYQTRRFGAPRENNMRRDSVPEGEPQPTLLDPKIEAVDPLNLAVQEVADLYREHGYKYTAESYPVKHIMDRLPTDLQENVSDGELEKAVIWWCVRDQRE